MNDNKKTITYTSENGFTGILYGESSMAIGVKNEGGFFRECFHTGSRSGDTFEYLKEIVDTYPEFLQQLEKIDIDDLKSSDSEDI